jgi:putative transcriptional regulator
MRCLVLILACLLGPALAAAQQDQPPNSLLLVAKPSLTDANFARSVVLVTQTEDGSTVGVIINRPTTLKLSQFLSDELPTGNYRAPIYFGGPVMLRALVAVFRSDTAPAAAAYPVLKGVYLTLHSDNIESLLKDPQARYRIYAGYSGWIPRQLESEMMRDSWYFLPADEATVFRETAEGMWEELLERAKRLGPRADR